MYFNRTSKYGLRVEYAGPDLLRQTIPDAVLFRACLDTDTTNGTTNFVNGLDYYYYEGFWWDLLPNFSHLSAVKTGVISNFDLNVKTREEHFGVQFNGYLQVARDGLYTFYTTSDDGSRLFIGDSSFKVEVIGKSALPTPRQLANNFAAPEAKDYEWSDIEGTVTSVSHLDGALEIDLATDSGRVLMKIAENSDCSFTLMPQNRIRAVGVSHNIFRLDGTKVACEFFVQNWSDIEQRYITPDLWANYPLLLISNTFDANFSGNSQIIVHLRGKIIQADSGQPSYLEDASGRIALEIIGTNNQPDKTLELVGRLDINGTNRVVRCAYFSHENEDSSEPGDIPVLTTAEQVYQLNSEELKRGYRVKLHGVITSVLGDDAAVIQDVTRGIFVSMEKAVPFQVGDYYEAEGYVQPGEYSPYIIRAQAKYIGSSSLPNPVLPTWDQLLNGSLQNQYVQLDGVITRMDDGLITLLTSDGLIKVGIADHSKVMPRSCLNARVRMRGCIFVSWDQATHILNVGKIGLDLQWLDVVQPALSDPFILPAKGVGDLLKFDPKVGILQRVKVSGQIIYQGDGGCFLMDGEKGLRFVYAGDSTAHICDLVDVVGFPDMSGPSPVLREAVVRRTGLAELPKPYLLKADNLVRDEYDSTLVRVDGVLLSMNSTPDGYVLEMQNGLRRFIATMKEKAGLDGLFVPGSRLELTGVYAGQGGNRVLGLPIESFRLLLNSRFDVQILSRPPWWTLRRLLTVMGVLAGVLLAALIWINQLHRKVNQRTRQLETQIQQRQHAERRHEIEQERARMAHDLHDDLGAGLTRVNMLTSLVNSPATTGEARTQYLTDLKVMAREMVTSLDEIVWAVNPRNDTLASLVGYFGAHAQQLLSLASVKCGLDVADALPNLTLDSKFRNGLLMAFKEAVTNIIRHSRATKAGLRICIENGVLILEVTDNGCGFNPAPPIAGADGLSNMQVRMSDLGGCCKIQSAPGKGTTVRFEVPLPNKSTSL
jgi:signal transduction histidine kinase